MPKDLSKLARSVFKSSDCYDETKIDKKGKIHLFVKKKNSFFRQS